MENPNLNIPTPQPEKPKSRLPLRITLALILVISLALLGYSIYQQFSKPQVKVETNNKVTNETKDLGVKKSPQPYNFVTYKDSIGVLKNGGVSQILQPPDKTTFAFVVNNDLWRDKVLITNQDINFDGYPDVAIVTSTGYAGVNFFYDYYIFNPARELYEKFLTNVCNPQFKSDQKLIQSSCKDGPTYLTTVYTFNGKTYIQGKTIDEFTK